MRRVAAIPWTSEDISVIVFRLKHQGSDSLFDDLEGFSLSDHRDGLQMLRCMMQGFVEVLFDDENGELCDFGCHAMPGQWGL